MAVTRYMEFVGGLGDAILRMYFSGREWYGALEDLKPGEIATVALMCHNPYLGEIFRWHPKRDQIDVKDLGFATPFHPWENAEWRLAHGLPRESPCPPYAPSETLKFFPGPEDREILERLRGERFLILSATASSEDKSVPQYIRHDAALWAIRKGLKVLVVGRSSYFHNRRRGDLEYIENDSVIDVVDKLSVPGTIEAVKISAGVVVAHSAVLHMAWHEHRPVFLLYNQAIKDNLLPHGPVGYMQGIGRPDTDHMEFSEYTTVRMNQWLAKI